MNPSHLYIHNVTHKTKSVTHAGHGQFTTAYTAASSTVAGRLTRSGVGAKFLRDQKIAEWDHMFYCASGAEINKGDILTLSSVDYEVVSTVVPSGAGHLECKLKRIERDG